MKPLSSSRKELGLGFNNPCRDRAELRRLSCGVASRCEARPPVDGFESHESGYSRSGLTRLSTRARRGSARCAFTLLEVLLASTLTAILLVSVYQAVNIYLRAQTAGREGITRAKAAVDLAASEIEGGIYVVGNAPTALLRLIELMDADRIRPSLVVGLPVGFVNAAESKALLLEHEVPHITNVGRKGGSNVAAAVVNALIIMAAEAS